MKTSKREQMFRNVISQTNYRKNAISTLQFNKKVVLIPLVAFASFIPLRIGLALFFAGVPSLFELSWFAIMASIFLVIHTKIDSRLDTLISLDVLLDNDNIKKYIMNKI